METTPAKGLHLWEIETTTSDNLLILTRKESYKVARAKAAKITRGNVGHIEYLGTIDA
jgi:hypothetical protein